jgi:hypothetical protein
MRIDLDKMDTAVTARIDGVGSITAKAKESDVPLAKIFTDKVVESMRAGGDGLNWNLKDSMAITESFIKGKMTIEYELAKPNELLKTWNMTKVLGIGIAGAIAYTNRQDIVAQAQAEWDKWLRTGASTSVASYSHSW